MARPGGSEATRIARPRRLANRKQNWNSLKHPTLIHLGRWAPPESGQARLVLRDPARFARSVFTGQKPELAAGHSDRRAARLVVCNNLSVAVSSDNKKI